mmetsp:Transcript_36876/g.45062  ORF Transcript_36876/g.45062 Transcript_36876/m.45062 type:complete len:185 (+) Transcript_36876:1698-2252(+)
MVKKDNLDFCLNRQVYDKQFFYLIKVTLQHIQRKLSLSQNSYERDYAPNFAAMHQAALNVSSKVIFDLLPTYSEGSQIFAGIADTAKAFMILGESWPCFKTSESDKPSLVCDWLESQITSDKCEYLLRLMTDCGSHSARTHAGALVAGAISHAFNILSVCKTRSDQVDSTKVGRLEAALRTYLS